MLVTSKVQVNDVCNVKCAAYDDTYLYLGRTSSRQ